MRREFHELSNPRNTKEVFINEGYQVISFGSVKKVLMDILKDKETANKYHLWNEILEPNNEEMIKIERQLENIVFKESRGGKNCYSIGWENGSSYLRYHSGIHYKWYR